MLSGLLTHHVLMTTDSVGGIWTYGLDLGRGLVARGTRVTLAVLGPGLDAERREQAAAAGLDPIDTGLQPEWLAQSPTEVARTAAAIATIARDRAVDLAHLNHPVLAGSAPFPCLVVGVAHSCVATWWQAVRGTTLPDDFAWRTALVAEGYRAVDALIAPSRAFAAATALAYPHACCAAVVHNGRAERLGGLGPVGPAAVFTAGRLWDEGKNLATLDRAAARLSAPVEAAGPLSGPNGSTIAFETIRAVGPLSEAEMAERFVVRPIYASPAFYEPFGLAVVEAAQAGCALVLSDIATFRELWDGAAVFVPARDAEALADAIEALLRNPTRRDALGQLARERARVYALDAMVDGTLAVHATVRQSAARRVAAG